MAWRLAVGKCQIIIAESKAVTKKDENVCWTSQKFSDIEYKPLSTFREASALTQCKHQIDFVLISSDNMEKLMASSKYLQHIITNDTIILVDSTYASGLDDALEEWFPNNLVLSVTSEVLVKVTVYDKKNVFNHVGSKVATMIGSTSSNAQSNLLDCLSGSSDLGKKLNQFSQILLANGVFPCNIIQNGMKPTIKSYIWKQIISFVSFGILSLIYGELKTDNSSHQLMMRRCFKEVLELACSGCKTEFPSINDERGCNQLFDQMVEQFNLLHSRYKIMASHTDSSVSDSVLLESPLCIYNFLNNFDTYIPLCLTQILQTANKAQINTPYIQCINSFYLEIDKIRIQKVYNWVKKESYRPEKPLAMPQAEIVSNINANNSSNTISSQPFDTAKNGDVTPITPLSNSVSSLPQGYVYYAPPEGMLAPNGKPNIYYPAPSYGGGFFNSNSTQKPLIQHPRFKNVPKEEVNGKKISYHQIKELIYPRTKGSTSPSDLTVAHKHIYQYANLNNTFESVNNRYGWADSLDVFKLSSGIQDHITEETGEKIKTVEKSDKEVAPEPQEEDNLENEETPHSESNSDLSNNDMDMEDADEDLSSDPKNDK